MSAKILDEQTIFIFILHGNWNTVTKLMILDG